MFFSTSKAAVAAILLLGTAHQTAAHSWVEMLNVIAPNGTYVGAPGYCRGNLLRSNPGFSDPPMVNLIPPNGRENKILDTDKICKDSQSNPTQTDGSPRLQAAAGDFVALRYQENGHVTIPNGQAGKPDNRGTVYIYGTTDPKADDTLLAIHKVWNADGTGGDKRGKLIATQNYDDKQCYQINSGPISMARRQQFPHTANQLMGADLWCQNNIALPNDLATGKPYTLYWVWDWPTAAGVDPGLPNGKAEIYTTCMDIDITNGATTNSAPAFVVGQDINNAAVPAIFNSLKQSSGNAPVADPAPGTTTTAATPAAGTGSPSVIISMVTVTTTVTAQPSACTTGMTSGVAIVPVAAPTPTQTIAKRCFGGGASKRSAEAQPEAEPEPNVYEKTARDAVFEADGSIVERTTLAYAGSAKFRFAS